MFLHFLFLFSIHAKTCLKLPKWSWEVIFLANPHLADILGDMDLDFENFHVFPQTTLACGGSYLHPKEYGLVVGFDKDQRNIEITVNRKGVKKNISVDARNLIPILRTAQGN